MNGKKIKTIVAIILVLFVIIGCALAYAYVQTDIFKTPEQLFKKYLAKNVEELKTTNLKPFDEIFSKMQTGKSETTFNIELESDGEKLAINSNAVSDTQNRETYIDTKIKDQDDNVYFNLEVLANQDVFGAQIDEFNDKYITIENRDLKKLAENLGMDQETINEIPDKIDYLNYEYSEEDMQKLSNLKEKYLEKINSQISEEAYSLEKNVQTDISGTLINANKYTLMLSTKEVARIENNIFTELFEDSDFITLYEKTGNKEELDKLKEDIIITDEEIENMEDKPVYFSVYENNGKTIKTEITCENDSIAFLIDNKDNESTLTLIIYEAKDDEKEVGETSIIKFNNKYENNVGTMSLSMETAYNEQDIEIVKEENSQDETWAEYYNDDYYAEMYKNEINEIILTTEKQDDNNMITKIDTNSINKILEDDYTEVKTAEISYKFNTNTEIPKVSEDNSIVINDYTQEDFEALMQELFENAYNSYDENQYSIIGALVRYFMMGTVLSEPNLDAGYYNY